MKNGVVERTVVALGVRDERAEMVEVRTASVAGDVLLLPRATKNVAPGAKVEVGPVRAAAPPTPPPALAAGTPPVAPPEKK